jgi:hypothetical protein
VAYELLESNPEVEALLRQAAPRSLCPLAGRERVAEAAMAIALFVSVLGLILVGPDPVDQLDAGVIAVLVVAYAIAHRVRFGVGGGMASPTQLVFLPMLLLLPVAIVPLLVAVAISEAPACLAELAAA